MACSIRNYEFKYKPHRLILVFLAMPNRPRAPTATAATSTLRARTAALAGGSAPKRPPAAAPKPPLLARRALYEDVAERLRSQIFARELQPGSWIDEQKLVLEYGISRTPLREALKVLAAEGLVAMKVRRGAYVAEVSTEDAQQVYHLLGLLESDAAAQVAANATPDQRAALKSLHQDLERTVRQRDTFFAVNEAFHVALLRAAGNRFAEQTVLDLRKVMKLNRHHSLFKQGRLGESLAEHREVMHAIELRDPQAARLAMQRHFSNGLDATR
jgi:DNA-binding GntR family transcriptional regulator